MKKHRLGRTPGLDIATVAVLLVAALVALFPVLWGLSTSLKTDGEVTTFPPNILPESLNLSNYISVFTKSDFMIYMKNSILITIIGVILATMIAAHAAYALTFFQLKINKALSFFILMTSMVPPVALLVPLYMMGVKIHL